MATPPRIASGAPAVLFGRQVQHLREQRRILHLSRASGVNVETVAGTAPFQLRTSQAFFPMS
eukprot:7378503-Alexandrium_andersonii.AAC.1